MSRIFLREFKLKLAKPVKSIVNDKIKRLSKRCLAQIVKVEEVFKAKIKIKENEYLFLPLTENSFNLKGKTHVFSLSKDEYNNKIIFIRTSEKANTSPGLNTQYSALSENIIISGYIIKQNDTKYFDYEDLVAVNENAPHINIVKLENNNLQIDV